MDAADTESMARRESALAYIEDMSAWYDEEAEGAPKIAYARQILDQIERRGELTPEESAWVSDRLADRF